MRLAVGLTVLLDLAVVVDGFKYVCMCEYGRAWGCMHISNKECTNEMMSLGVPAGGVTIYIYI